VSFAAFNSLLTVNILLRVATAPLRSTMPRLGRKSGVFYEICLSCEVSILRSVAFISVLVDESAGKTGDLYIRSVRFSPDGKYLATGAEDRQIRVNAAFS
jgi:WD40 repeat protein